MRKTSITAHCLVRNEANWIWYALNSVKNHVDQILVFDTGSTDKTVKIVKSIKSPKIIVEQRGVVNKKEFTQLRQEMVDRTETSWFMILDGDEVWPEKTIQELVQAIKQAPKTKHAVVVGQWTCIGDVFHYSVMLAQEKQVNMPKNLVGYRQARAIKMIPGLHCTGLYGYESYADKAGVDISDWDQAQMIFIKNKYLHLTFLPRSSSRKKDRQVMMRAGKTRFYKGVPFPENFKYPEVFYKRRPKIVPSPWRKLTVKDQTTGLYYRAINIVNRLLGRY